MPADLHASMSSVPAGAVIFTVTNKGKVSHDFKIAGKKTPLLSPGHTATPRVRSAVVTSS